MLPVVAVSNSGKIGRPAVTRFHDVPVHATLCHNRLPPPATATMLGDPCFGLRNLVPNDRKRGPSSSLAEVSHRVLAPTHLVPLVIDNAFAHQVCQASRAINVKFEATSPRLGIVLHLER